MTQQHLKPDEVEMFERAEKATKGHDAEGVRFSIDTHHGLIKSMCDIVAFVPKHDDMVFYGNAKRDLSIILTRLANERARLAIAMEALEGMGLGEFEDYELPRVARETLRRIEELEQQHGKT